MFALIKECGHMAPNVANRSHRVFDLLYICSLLLQGFEQATLRLRVPDNKYFYVKNVRKLS